MRLYFKLMFKLIQHSLVGLENTLCLCGQDFLKPQTVMVWGPFYEVVTKVNNSLTSSLVSSVSSCSSLKLMSSSKT